MRLWVREKSMNEQEPRCFWGLWGCRLPKEVWTRLVSREVLLLKRKLKLPGKLSSCIFSLLDMELGGWDSSPEPAAIKPCVFVLITVSLAFSSVAQSCMTLCDPMNRSTPGLPVHHHLPEFTQTHVHQIGDAIQPSHPLSSPFPPAPNPSQHQSLFQWP